MEELKATYKQLLNETLPAAYTYPVRFNHCFNRVVLDWLFQDCWYHHLSRQQTAISQLTEAQLKASINRMQQWLQNQQLLIDDNIASLQFRKKHVNLKLM